MPATSPASPPMSAVPVSEGKLRRSGAVARMLRMPVATLRVWERRYRLTEPLLSPSGQRLYSEEDVRRLALIRQLTDLGHAIGTLAGLDMDQLQQVAAAHAQAQQLSRPVRPPAQPRAWRVAVVGRMLGARLQRPAVLQRLTRPVQLLGVFDTIADAAAALQGNEIDTLLLHEPQLHAGWLAAAQAGAPSLAGVPMAVLYGFAAEAVCDSLAAVEVMLLREPQPDAVLAQWLRGVAASGARSTDGEAPPPGQFAARRWEDAALADFINRSTTVACECPRHVADLLVQLAHFERYSATCEHRNPADARLHAFLQEVAAESRIRFESALEQIALHEGVLLPPPEGQR